MAAANISSVISGMTCVTPVRATSVLPGSSASMGKRRSYSRASASRSGSACAVATGCSRRSASRMRMEHQSAISGTAMSATLRSVSS
jgi:hypothetical protein